MKQCFSVQLILLSGLLFSPLNVAMVFGEFECASHVHYRWEVHETGESKHHVEDGAKQDEAEKTKAKMPKVSFDVLSVTRRIRAATEDEAKAKIQLALDKDKQDAMEECQSVHENLSGCIAAKFLAMGNVLRQLDFNARKELENSISEDCRSSTGRCLKSEASPIECHSLEPKKEDNKKESEEAKKKK